MRKQYWILLLLAICMISSCAPKESYTILYEAKKVEEEQTLKEQEIKKHFRIAYIPKVGNIPYFESVYEGVLEAAKQFDIELIYDVPTEAKAEIQMQIVEKAIQKEVDAIAVSVIDSKSLSPVLQRAREKGIKVVTWDADAEMSTRDLFVDMVDAENLGRHLMDQLALQTNEVGEFAIMTGSFSANNHNEWVKWIQTQWKEYYPNMKLVEVVSTNDDPQKAYAVAKTLLANYPSLKGIIGNSSVGPPAAAQAVKDTQKVGEVAVVGLSTPNLMRSYLHDGSAQVATLWSPKKLGYLTIALTQYLLTNKPITDNDVIQRVGAIRFEEQQRRIIMGEPIDFTKENVDQYEF
ncbi:ABC transporter substrate-binding protein [Lysinibacillus contaminans]|uniref:ABC transporter substrate-binding protein n=2 Tax=Lysinibacillus contaminans TaxID=1293441 RepID=A0ABR5K4E1_9BACI|nr:ABC transporter substrate-binding protein [Lysinibacillus contaminans]